MYTPRKRFGQHFLHDKTIIQNIIQAVFPEPGQDIIEIGPGQGALTFPLLRKIKRLTAIELDRDLIESLRLKAKESGELRILNEDVLNVDFTALAGSSMLRIVGNLPYNISTPILFHSLKHANVLHDMHFMLQKEVVDRMAAKPGSKVYGRLSVMLQLRCRVEQLFDVPPAAFRPPPKVDSAVVRLIPLPFADIPATEDGSFIDQVVRTAFVQRRKTLANALRGLLTADQINQAGIDPKLRAEQLTPHQYVELAKLLKNSPANANQSAETPFLPG